MLKQAMPGSPISTISMCITRIGDRWSGGLVVPIKEREQFKEATRTKLVLEIRPEARTSPAYARASCRFGQSPRISCTIGERMWQQRWGAGPQLQ